MAKADISSRLPTLQDLTGQRFGRLTAVGYAGYSQKMSMWSCVCDCGTVRVLPRQRLVQGLAKSCGCLKREVLSRPRKHKNVVAISKRKNSLEYTTYCGIKRRCLNKKDKSYRRYGAKGISVCDRWLFGEEGLSGFECFVLDMGLRTADQTIDRLDNAKGYSPENCRWATQKQQNNNYSRNRRVTAFGKTQNLSEWGIEYGIDGETIAARLKRGWPEEKAIADPVIRTGRWKNRGA